MERGETPEQGLTRELEEELGILGAEGREIMRYEFAYPGRPPVTLIFFRVIAFAGEPRNLEFRDMRWEPVVGLPAFDFVEGDRKFLRQYVGNNTKSPAAGFPGI